jgi:hypothetical protein
MRIIKERHKTLTEYLLVCCNCGSELGVTEKDCSAGLYNEPVIKCPVCKTYNDFNSKTLQVIGEIPTEN